MMLTEAHAKHYAEWSPDATENTLKRHRYDLKRWSKLMGDSDISSVTTRTFAKYRKLARDAGQAPRTINTTTRTVAQVLRCCHEFGEIEQAPLPGRQLRITAPEPAVPSGPQLDALYRATHLAKWPRAHVRPWEWWRCLMVVAIWTGLRRTDLLWGLSWQNVDFDERVIQFRASKTQKRHQFPIPPVVERHLRAMLPPGGNYPATRPVFGPSNAIDKIRRELRRFSAAADVEPAVTMQTFRRSSITLWSKADATAGQLVHGTGLPRVMLHYLDPLAVLQSASDRFPWPAIMQERQPGDVFIP